MKTNTLLHCMTVVSFFAMLNILSEQTPNWKMICSVIGFSCFLFLSITDYFLRKRKDKALF